MSRCWHIGSRLLLGVVGSSAVLCGALGAHALRRIFSPEKYSLWHTAVSYHFWHALALALVLFVGHGRSAYIAVITYTLGIIFFCGSLYALSLGAPTVIGWLTPLGGLCFIAGWIALAFSLRRTC